MDMRLRRAAAARLAPVRRHLLVTPRRQHHHHHQPPTPPESESSARDAAKSINNATFFKTFGRPIAKVFLLAMFTYQVVYYGWERSRLQEDRTQMQGTVDELEDKVAALEKARKGT